MGLLCILQGHQELELGQLFSDLFFRICIGVYLTLCQVGQVGCPEPDLLCSSTFVFYVLVQLSDYFLSRVLLWSSVCKIIDPSFSHPLGLSLVLCFPYFFGIFLQSL